MLERLTVKDFEPLVGQGFRVSYPAHAETLTLTEASLLPRHVPPEGHRAAFSLVFEGESREIHLNQKIHRLENDTMGQFDLFLVPIGRTEAGTFRYEAVFT
ncbi:hypothetical protein [Azospirillum sp. SYSU D00513]|uniref:DUF6916 family protein n=1 Tax=Azospirillum sp. SYSU D00513 TaxID=2812561 RepID=UPI001A9674C4|nr:hypothetical protein [Azospirillum sp. SYSU D00513]